MKWYKSSEKVPDNEEVGHYFKLKYHMDDGKLTCGFYIVVDFRPDWSYEFDDEETFLLRETDDCDSATALISKMNCELKEGLIDFDPLWRYPTKAELYKLQLNDLIEL